MIVVPVKVYCAAFKRICIYMISSKILLQFMLYASSMWVRKRKKKTGSAPGDLFDLFTQKIFVIFLALVRKSQQGQESKKMFKKSRHLISCALTQIRLDGSNCNVSLVSLRNKGPTKPNSCFAALSAITRPPAHKWTSRVRVFASAPLLPFDLLPGPGAAATTTADAFQRPFPTPKETLICAVNTSTVNRRASRRRRAPQVSLMSKH